MVMAAERKDVDSLRENTFQNYFLQSLSCIH